MQVSMGQTLNGLLEMNGEYTDGDTEESVEKNLLLARHALVEAVRTGSDCSAPVNKLLHLKCPVAMKYGQLNVIELLRENSESVATLKSIPVALGMLEKYGRHLLKPPQHRVDQWRQIKFNNPIFKDRVRPMKGALDVVKQLGYSEPVDSGLQFVAGEPDIAATSNLLADIVLARAEMDRYLGGTHPHPDAIHTLLPESTTEQLAAHWQPASTADTSTLGLNPVSSMALHQVLSPPTPEATHMVHHTPEATNMVHHIPEATNMVHRTPEEESEAGLASPTLVSEARELGERVNSGIQQLDDSLRKVCDICGDEAAITWCKLCDNKQLCEGCDEKWHRHPKRTSHHREPIASLPSPSSATAPGSNIMGPFGIRAVHSLSVLGSGHQSPASGGSVHSAESASASPRATPPPPPSSQPAPSPSGRDPQASLQQHHQQLQYYQQLQQKQWEQQQLLQQQQQQQADFNRTSQFSPTQPHYERGMAQEYGSLMRQEHLHTSSLLRTPGAAYPSVANAYPSVSAPFPAQAGSTPYLSQSSPYPVQSSPYPAQSPYQVGFEHFAESSQHMPAVSQQQQFLGSATQPDVGAQRSVLTGGETLPSGLRKNAAPPQAHADVSLRQSQVPVGPERHRLSGGPAESVGSLVHGLHRATSVPGGGGLLSKVLAESNYEKRAAKCDIHLLTLSQEMDDVEQSLNDLMLSHDDFCELEEFRTLNRRKAFLIREHKTLSNYRQELQELMETETQSGDQAVQSRDTCQVYHPPPLTSFPSTQPSGTYPRPHSPVGPQHGLGYPQQVSQSPMHPSEYVAMPVAYPAQMQPVSAGYVSPVRPVSAYSSVSQPQLHHGAPGVQESIAHSRSSVDRSSILPQWQMVPPSTGASQPPTYQYGQTPLAVVTPSSTGQPFHYPVQATVSSPPNRGVYLSEQNSVAQGYQPPANSAHLVHSQSTAEVSEASVPEFHRPNSAPSLPQAASAADQNGPHIALETGQAQQWGSTGPERKSMQVLPPPPPTAVQQAFSQTTPPTQRKKFGSPQQEWQCNHCTLINPPGTRVCAMCDRTSDNPVLVSSLLEATTSPPVHDPPLISPPLPSPSLAPAAAQAATATASETAFGQETGTDVNKVDLTRVRNRIAEEQDKIYEEKKEAQKRYLQSLREGSSPHQAAEVQQTSAPSPSPKTPPEKFGNKDTASASPLQERTVKVEAAATQKREPSSQGAEGGVTPVPQPQQKTKQQNRLSSAGGNIGELGSSGARSHSSSGMGSLDSQTSFIKEDFSQAMEHFSQQKKIKEMQHSGRELMQFIKTADRQGHDLEEMEVALTRCESKQQEALTWLQKEWSKLIEVVIASTKASGQRCKQNDIGELSHKEAREALKKSGGEMTVAVDKCVTARKELYAKLNPGSVFAREEVLEAMLRNEGDEELAREQLHAAMLQPFLRRVWEGLDGEGAGQGTGTLLMRAMAESCQSVATSVISHQDFQQTVMNKDIDKDRRIRMVLVEGKLQSWGRAELVIRLLDEHLPAAYTHDDSHYTLEDVVEAVRNCRDRQSALAYLTQECSICLAPYPMGKIRNLNFCQCKICSDCLKQNFEVVIREKHVRHWTCPICSFPDLNDTDTAQEYLSFLGMLLQTQVDQEVFELFETKVRDWYLQKDPNFRWCAHCGNGFIADGGQLRMMCPHCGDKTCYKCKKQWEDQHEGLTCEQFAQWKIDNDPNNQAVGLARHLEENGIDCPSCKMRYALAKGGCMHFKCPQCGHEFCSGCYQPFYQRGMCTRLKTCKNSGLHAHHPRDCFFYLRDDDVDRLQSLLRDANVQFNTVPPDSQSDMSHCPVIEQKEFDYGKQDEPCGKDVQAGYAGLCVIHYKEYLVGLINKNNIDPVIMMTVDDMKKLISRAEMSVPKKTQNDSEAHYRKRLMKFIREKLPLPSRTP